MKKALAVILSLMLCVLFAGPAMANNGTWFRIGDNQYSVNGQALTMDVAPYIENGRTMLPVRYVAESLGIPDSNIRYDQSTQTVTIIDVGSTNGAIQLTIGSDIMSVVGGQVTMDTAPEIRNGRVFLPIKWIAQGLGASVSWDANTQQVTIGSSGGQGSTQPTTTAQVPPPSMSPDGGTFTTAQTVTVSNIPSGDTAYYTTDNTNPMNSGTRIAYGGAFTVSQSEIVQVANQDQYGSWSPIQMAIFTINNASIGSGTTGPVPPGPIAPYSQVPSPCIAPAGGTFSAAQIITISNVPSGDTAYYTTDGSNPENSSTRIAYSIPFTVSQSETLFAATTDQSGNWSGILGGTFTINAPATVTSPTTVAPPPEPTITPDGGTFTNPVTVTIGNIPVGDTAYYNNAASNPETNGTPYTGPFVESSSNTVSTATRDQYGNWSSVAQTTFNVIGSGANATPVITPNGGTFTGSVTVSISNIPSGYAAYYTYNNPGTNPETNGIAYTGPFVVNYSGYLNVDLRGPNGEAGNGASTSFTITPDTAPIAAIPTP